MPKWSLSTVSCGTETNMKYRLDEDKLLMIYEVYLPKKFSYKRKLREVLDAFLSSDGLNDVPAVQQWLSTLETATRATRLQQLRNTISGYSIYQVKGRFLSEKGPIDEATWVIRFLIHDPTATGGMKGEIRSLAKTAVIHFITRRFAEELGTEDEIWSVAKMDQGVKTPHRPFHPFPSQVGFAVPILPSVRA